MKPFKRICVIVLDSLGLGALPDAEEYGDAGANTLLHTYDTLKRMNIPNLARFGLLDLVGRAPKDLKTSPAYFMRMFEASLGKDTATGHWEMMGIILKEPFDTFWNGFPPDLMQRWSELAQCGYLGNKPASGTEIMAELGAEHIKTGNPIVYTSADSVFQIAAHEKYFGLDRLYNICAMTRELLNNSTYLVGRVIARPFLGEPGSFKRTGNRKDYALSPFEETVLDRLKSRGIFVAGIGKIPSIFNYSGITKEYEAHNDEQALNATIEALKKDIGPGVIFVNVNDLDMVYGHRRDAKGYGQQIEYIDKRLSEIIPLISADDLLILTADHGNDPTYKGTDHTREFVPLILYSPHFGEGARTQRQLPDRKTFADIGQTLCENFSIAPIRQGKNILGELA